MKVLFVAFEFPPLASGGVHRSIRLTKYLSRLGLRVDVVTVRQEDYKLWSPAPIDETLTKKIPQDAHVHRISSGFPNWYWKVTRNKFGRALFHYGYWGDPTSFFWRKPLFSFLEHLLSKNRPDVLLATVPPFGVAQLAYEVSKRYRLPCVIDWRDPWTLLGIAPFPSYFHYSYTRSQEAILLKGANFSICTSPVTRQDWLNEFEGLDPKRLDVIYNSFDPEEFDGLEDKASTKGSVRIVHVGNFYYEPKARDYATRPWWCRSPRHWLLYRKRKEDWLYRSPYFFLRGLRRFSDCHSDLAGKLNVIFSGPVPVWLPRMLDETETSNLVTVQGPLSHSESIRLQRGADAVLLTSAKVDGGPDYSIGGKLFEYLGLRKRILAVLTDGAMRDIVVQSGLGFVADPDNADEISECIRRIVVGETSSVSLTTQQEEYIESFRSENMARQMTRKLELAVQEGFRGIR